MPSFVQITQAKTLPEQKVNVYETDDNDNIKIVDSFGVVFNALSRKEIERIIERFRDDDDDFGQTDALNLVVAKYGSGWTDIPTKLTDIQDSQTKELVKEVLSITDPNKPFTEKEMVKMLNNIMRKEADATWATFLNNTGSQFEAHTNYNKSKSKRRRK